MKSALAQWSEAGSAEPAPAGNQLFAGAADARPVTERAKGTTPAPSQETTPSEGPADTPTAPAAPTPVDADPALHKVATLDAVEASPVTAPRRSWLALVLATVCALALGLAVGWFARGSGDTGDASPVTTAAEQVAETASSAGTDSDADIEPDQAPVPDDTTAIDELQAEIDVLTTELDGARSELDTLTAERDNEQAHNDILQTWFTPEVRDRSERNWDAEVQRACAAEAAPTVDNTSYTRAMELMGTHADLVAAVAACQAGG